MTLSKQKSNCIPSITFFFPYKEVSGVPVLFLRMAEYIANNYDIETRIVDYPDGYMARTLQKVSLVKLIHFRDRVPLEISADTVLVMQSLLPSTIRPELKINNSTRIIFWTLHQFNLIPTIMPLSYFRHLQARYIIFNNLVMDTFMISFKKKLQNLINIFAEKKSIFFPDGSTLSNTLKRIDVSINNPIYIPVPCNLRLTNRKKTRQSVEQNGISFCWVGRLCDFKIHILVYTIKKLSDYSVRKKKLIYMYIIGDGPKSNIIRKLNVENGFFHIINVGVLMGQSLSEYLLDNIDVLVAMGASALDGAILGIPTIRLDISYGPISEDYKFKWIFESKKYELADIIDHSHFNKNNDTLDRIIDSIDNEYSLISDKTYEYCVQNHSISSVCDKFIDALSEASFRYGDFSPDILKKGFIRKSYEFVRRIYHSFK